jgi:hypothetical protein
MEDNSHRTNMIALSADQHSDSRIVGESRQIAGFSEPQQRTTLVQGVDQPVASSQYSTIKSTIMTKNDHRRGEKRRIGNHDGKNSTKQSGRPRLNTVDSTQAEVRNFLIIVVARRADSDY